jgi:hypothetical protein
MRLSYLFAALLAAGPAIVTAKGKPKLEPLLTAEFALENALGPVPVPAGLRIGRNKPIRSCIYPV